MREITYAQAIQEAGIKVHIEILDYGAEHPNTYRLTIKNSTEQHHVTAISTGGGMINVIEIDGVNISIAGDYYETLVYLDSDSEKALQYLVENVDADEILLLENTDVQIIEIKAQHFPEERVISELGSTYHARSIKTLSKPSNGLNQRSFYYCEMTDIVITSECIWRPIRLKKRIMPHT